MNKKCLALVLCSLHISWAWAQRDNRVFEQVFDAIGSPKTFSLSFEDLLQQLHPWCALSTNSEVDQAKRGNVTCAAEANIRSITVSAYSDRTIGFIQANFNVAENCLYMRNSLTKKFGKPSIDKRACDVEWRLKLKRKDARQRYVNMEASEVDNAVYFSIGEDQGP